jgi:hypothetical protein
MSPLVSRPLFGLLQQSRKTDNDEYGAVSGITGRGNRKY